MEVGGQSHAQTALTLPIINSRFLERTFHSLITIRTDLSPNKRINSLCQRSIALFKYYEPGKGVGVDCRDVYRDCHNSVSRRDLWSKVSVNVANNMTEIQTEFLLHLTEDTARNLAHFWVYVNCD
jgi:hypothetical protein